MTLGLELLFQKVAYLILSSINLQGFFWGKRCGDVSVLMIQILSFSGRVGHTIHGVC